MDGIGYTDASLWGLPQAVYSAMAPVVAPPVMEPAFKKARSEPSTTSASSDSGSTDEEERRRLDRERNRQHARNTRARKKAYVEELQAQLTKMTQEKDAILQADAVSKQRTSAKQSSWVASLRKAMDLRAAGSVDVEAWRAVVTEDIKLTLPITPYRSFNASDVISHRRVMLGVEGVIADTSSLMVMCDLIGEKRRSKEGRVHIEYLLGTDPANCFFGPEGLMCTYMMRSTDARDHGALCEVEQSGLMRVRFSENDARIEELEMSFDGIAFYHQLMRANGKEEFPLVPNTLETAMRDEVNHVVITTAVRPFRITHVNKAWTELCGFELDECKGSNLSILQGPETDMSTVNGLCKLTQQGFPASMVVTNYNKEGRAFRNHLKCYPVTSDETGEISHIVGMLDEIVEQ